MKLSSFLAVSVPILAASQVPAMAADPNNSGAWLQESISALTPAKAKMSSTTYAQAQAKVHVRHSAPAGMTAQSVKLRPFKPGRYLPSEKDLRAAALQAQQAQYDNSAGQQQQGGMLSGQVSSQYAAAPRAVSPYDQYAMPSGFANSMPSNPVYAAAVPRVKAAVKRMIGQRAPRVVPNQMPMLPEQLTQAPMIQPNIPEPPVQRQMRAPFPVSMPVGQFPQPQATQMPMQGSPAFEPADISPQEMAAMHRQVEMNKPTARMNFNGEMIGQASDNPGNGIGQPPFPLNFFGGNAMQSLTQGQRPAHVPPARFGSWHHNSGLADAGFHSYVARRRPVQYDYVRAAAPTPVKRSTSAASKSVLRSYSAPPAVAQQRQRPIAVATYPAYTSYRSTY